VGFGQASQWRDIVEIEFKIGGLGIEVEVKGVRGLATLLGIAALGAAVVRELRIPPGRRTWHGRLAGAVPYDLRPPTPERLRAAIWDPANRDVLVPTAFGVGWTVNLAALAGRCGRLAPPVPRSDATPHSRLEPASR
jgi:hypothetical protein